MQNSPQESKSEEVQGQAISRRELLKTLAAAGGVLTAAAFLPGKWSKPVVQMGVLPAHAQDSANCWLVPGVCTSDANETAWIWIGRSGVFLKLEVSIGSDPPFHKKNFLLTSSDGTCSDTFHIPAGSGGNALYVTWFFSESGKQICQNISSI